jgi:hypothetical protein
MDAQLSEANIHGVMGLPGSRTTASKVLGELYVATFGEALGDEYNVRLRRERHHTSRRIGADKLANEVHDGHVEAQCPLIILCLAEGSARPRVGNVRRDSIRPMCCNLRALVFPLSLVNL